ncbi:MAG: YebC/PmpR family DNA-binding transcriptional regulator [Bacillota bacterium]
MAGHSKWANIKHRKAKADAQKSNLFSKLIREVMVAARQGGGNPDSNLRLKLAIQKARENNVPNDSINRAMRKGTGEGEVANFEEVIYEGYGPGGAAILVEAVTDNKNRTTGEIRYLFSRHGGNMSEAGSVAWMFRRRGYLAVDRKKCGLDEEEVLLVALEAGAEDMESDEESYEIFTAPEELTGVQQALEQAGVPVEVSEVTMTPQAALKVTGDDAVALLKLVDILDEHDDVQRVHSNFDIDQPQLPGQSGPVG